MTSNWKFYASYIVGAMIGALAGKLLADKILSEKSPAEELAETIVENAINSENPDTYWDGTPKNEGDNIATNNIEIFPPNAPGWVKEEDIRQEKAVISGEDSGEKLEKKSDKKPAKPVDYSGISKYVKDNKGPISDIVRKYVSDESEDDQDAPDPSKPYIISLGQYAESQADHAKVTLTFYEFDDILVNIEDEVIQNPEKILGDDALVSFGRNSGDIDSVYVRNTTLKTDYEVVRLHRAYSEAVLGKPVEKKKTRPKTRKVAKIDDDVED